MLQEHLNGITANLAAVITETIEINSEGIGKVTLVDSDIGTFITSVAGPESEQFEVARENLARSIYLAASGFYSQAFSSLRLCLELSFAGVYFSANEYKRRRWISDKEDFSWSKALDSETGVLSAEFVNEFYAELAKESDKYARDSASAYRQCSQFIHGKQVATSKISARLDFQDEVLSEWSSCALKAGEAILFLLLVRYGKEDNFKSNEGILSIVQERFGRIRAVRNALGMVQ